MNLPGITDPPLVQALACARLSALAYEPAPNLTGLPHATPFVSGNDRGFYAVNSECVLIAIAGTNDLSDWWFNSRVDFIEAATRIAIVLGQHNLRQDVPWYFTGHSRGGAIAQHLPSALNLTCPAIVCTFGTPRSMRGQMSYGVSYSYILPGDPVPLVPLWSRGWRDPGGRIYLHESGADDEWPWMIFIAMKHAVEFCVRWRVTGAGSAFAWAREKHAMGRYVSRLETLAMKAFQKSGGMTSPANTQDE